MTTTHLRLLRGVSPGERDHAVRRLARRPVPIYAGLPRWEIGRVVGAELVGGELFGTVAWREGHPQPGDITLDGFTDDLDGERRDWLTWTPTWRAPAAHVEPVPSRLQALGEACAALGALVHGFTVALGEAMPDAVWSAAPPLTEGERRRWIQGQLGKGSPFGVPIATTGFLREIAHTHHKRLFARADVAAGLELGLELGRELPPDEARWIADLDFATVEEAAAAITFWAKRGVYPPRGPAETRDALSR